MKIDAARSNRAVILVVSWFARDLGTESGSMSFTPAGKRVGGVGECAYGQVCQDERGLVYRRNLLVRWGVRREIFLLLGERCYCYQAQGTQKLNLDIVVSI